MSDGRLHPRHLRQARLCMDGARQWFARRDWSWSEFVSAGRPLEDFEATGCPLAARAVKVAREEVAGGGR